MPSKTAALYLRSSKDRNDVSIDAQRRELEVFAESRGLKIVQEYADAVESAKDDRRPSFQRMVVDIKGDQRSWNHLLCVDTSRLSRNRHIAIVLKWECKKRNIEILYSKLSNDVDPISWVVLEAVFEAFDQMHSMMSREKGLAGMAENVRQGYRAGGRAPKGYQLKKVATGATREGSPVTKSVLEPNDDAPAVKRFLELRAAGKPRGFAKAEAGLSWCASTLINMEWSAFTYAGFNVWNVHAERIAGTYKGGSKRRPRSEWVVEPGPHEAFITGEQAETLVSALEISPASQSRLRQVKSPYLLSGILRDPEGSPWHGARSKKGARLYRLNSDRGINIDAELVEDVVWRQVIGDLSSDAVAQQLCKAWAEGATTEPEGPAVERRLQTAKEKVQKTVRLAAMMDDPEPVMVEVKAQQASVRKLETELAEAEKRDQSRNSITRITPEHVRAFLGDMTNLLSDADTEKRKRLLSQILDRATLGPDRKEVVLRYVVRVGDTDNVASPRELHAIRAIEFNSLAKVA